MNTPDTANAYLIGGGIASLSAAVLLIRDGGFRGANIRILEELDVAGGALDGSGDALKGYVIGIFMPHMHDEQTGGFEPLPADLIQVESGLEVSFRPTGEIASQPNRFLPVGWLWRAGAAAPVAACEMDAEEGRGDTRRYVKHKMPDED